MRQDNKSVAVVDLGSNTFHAVIFEKSNSGEIIEIYRKRHHVFLSKGGVETILQESIDRAYIAVADFAEQFQYFEPTEIHIVGTEALRKASNGLVISAHIEETLGAKVNLISGKREAELIAKGVLWQFGHLEGESLIMDIGGGSIEFIHIVNNEVAWLQSFPVGIGVVYNKFQHQEPILASEKSDIVSFLDDGLSVLTDYLHDKKIDTLIGASGSFELIPSIIEGEYPPKIERSTVTLQEFETINRKIQKMDLPARLQMKGLPPVRAQLVVVSFIIMEWIVRRLDCKKILISKYAVKEGLVAEKLEF